MSTNKRCVLKWNAMNGKANLEMPIELSAILWRYKALATRFWGRPGKWNTTEKRRAVPKYHF